MYCSNEVEMRIKKRSALSAERRKKASATQFDNTAPLEGTKPTFTGPKHMSFSVSFLNINKIPNRSLPNDVANDLKGDILFLGETNPAKILHYHRQRYQVTSTFRARTQGMASAWP